MASPLSIVVSENRTGAPAARALQEELLAALSSRPGVELAVVPHVYDLQADSAALAQLREAPGDILFLGWLSPRAAFWVLQTHAISGRMGRTSQIATQDGEENPSQPVPGEGEDGRTLWCFDLRQGSRAAAYLAEIDRLLRETGRLPLDAPAPGLEKQPIRRFADAATPRWYPVIDFSRCVNCQECINFCLFGVYGLDAEGRVFVESPDNCRDGCPACARVCGQAAILFPQHHAPAIAGSDSRPEADGPAVSDLTRLPILQDWAPAEPEAARPSPDLPSRAAPPTPSPSSDALDRLVDDVDGMEL